MSAQELPAGGLETILRAGDGVIVGVPPRDRAAARRELGHDVVLFDLASDPNVPLSELGAKVFEVPGRCVVLARRTGEGWETLTTPGSWTGPPQLVQKPASPPAPTPIPKSRFAWAALGASFGILNFVSGFATVELGPLVGEVSLGTPMPLLWIDAYWRVGASMPLPSPRMKGIDRLELGLVAGQRGQAFGALMGQDGYTAGLVVFAHTRTAPHLARLLRVTVGIDHYTSSWSIDSFGGPQSSWFPALEFGAGVAFR